MKILAVDDEAIALDGLVSCIEKAEPDAEVRGFRSGLQALDFVGKNPCDVAFLDIEMRELDGIELARRLKRENPKINLIFATGYSAYAGDALSLRASGYLLKPVTAEKVRQELDELRHPVAPEAGKRVRVQTFGDFEVFIGGRPAKFRYSKTKELLAYLVDRRGALCANDEIMAVLWEDRTNDSYFKKLRDDLLQALSEAGCGDIIARQWGKIGVLPQKLDCDYYNWLDGRLSAINAYNGEYMTQYSWGEMTLGRLHAKNEP